jgi:uncharacterized tellurite resistance protein B-like protein
MALSDLRSILGVFRGSEAAAKDTDTLFKEVLLMTLARASNADANINPREVETVQRVLAEVTGDQIAAKDIRVAAASELYESAPLEDYLAYCADKLAAAQRAAVARSLAAVIKSDERISPREITFLNNVVRALELTPAELLGLVAETS